MSKLKSFTLILGVIIMSFLIGYLVLAWEEPTAAPPGANVPAPLNVGPNEQWKLGADAGIGVSTGTTFNLDPGQIAASSFIDTDAGCEKPEGTWIINPSGTSYFCGNVGIGATGPIYKLDVAGIGRFTETLIMDKALLFRRDEANVGKISTVVDALGNTVLMIDARASDTDKVLLTENLSVSGTLTASFATIQNTLLSGEIYTTGNVGIGTPGANYLLDVSGGDINVSGVYRRGGTAGLSLAAACGAGEVLKGINVLGGIVTAGTCAEDLSGAGAFSCSDLDNCCATDGKILKRSAGTWGCADDAVNDTIASCSNVYGCTSPTNSFCSAITGHNCGYDNYAADTNANTLCTGTTTYLDGDGNCDDISDVYVNESGDTITGSLTVNGDINIGWELKSSNLSIPANGGGNFDVLCSSGKTVIGGGCAWSGVYKLLEISISKPRTDGAGWTCGGTNEAASAYTLTAYAICARLAP